MRMNNSPHRGDLRTIVPRGPTQEVGQRFQEAAAWTDHRDGLPCDLQGLSDGNRRLLLAEPAFEPAQAVEAAVVAAVNIMHDVATDRSNEGDRIASQIPNEVPAGRNRGRALKRRTQPEVNIVPGSEPIQQLQSVRAQGTLVA